MTAQGDMTVQRSQFQSSEIGAPKGDADDAYWGDPYCNADTAGFSGKYPNIKFSCYIKSNFFN
jgi:chitinase